MGLLWAHPALPSCGELSTSPLQPLLLAGSASLHRPGALSPPAGPPDAQPAAPAQIAGGGQKPGQKPASAALWGGGREEESPMVAPSLQPGKQRCRQDVGPLSWHKETVWVFPLESPTVRISYQVSSCRPNFSLISAETGSSSPGAKGTAGKGGGCGPTTDGLSS